MLRVAFRLAGPDVLTPWRSPLLRWRMETYGLTDARGHLLHAEAIGPAKFAQFLLQQHTALRRFLRWAAAL